jgi:catechol 2,3-dioxygenase-like lactoylglutathione lyase family enzyme
MSARFDHIDLHVPDLAAVIPFYRRSLSELGFVHEAQIENWFQLETEDGSAEVGLHNPKKRLETRTPGRAGARPLSSRATARTAAVVPRTRNYGAPAGPT